MRNWLHSKLHLNVKTELLFETLVMWIPDRYAPSMAIHIQMCIFKYRGSSVICMNKVIILSIGLQLTVSLLVSAAYSVSDEVITCSGVTEILQFDRSCAPLLLMSDVIHFTQAIWFPSAFLFTMYSYVSKQTYPKPPSRDGCFHKLELLYIILMCFIYWCSFRKI